MTATLEDIAAELYALPLEDFTAVRNERSKAVTDHALAARVKSLRKPLAPAWIVNLFARERPDQLAQALELGESLRAAQEELDARTLTALTRQRRALVRELAAVAIGLAEHAGAHATVATTTAVEQTLNAAMLDAGAADAVASGRLIRPLEPSGSGTIDVSDAVAGALARRPVRETPPDELAKRRARKDAEKAVRSAEQQVQRAERLLRDAERDHEAASRRVDELRRREAEAAAELERVRSEMADAAEALTVSAARRDQASEELEPAREALDEARASIGE